MSSLKPPQNTLWVTSWRDLPARIGMAKFAVTDQSGETRTFYVRKNKRRILETLMRRPMFCASPCRLSHFIMGLRDEQGLNIETEWFDNDPKTGRERYGIYKLLDKVTRIDGQENGAS